MANNSGRNEQMADFVNRFCEAAVPTATYIARNAALLSGSLLHYDAITYQVSICDRTLGGLFPLSLAKRGKVFRHEYTARAAVLAASPQQLVVPFTILVSLLGVEVLAYPRARTMGK